ncbi:MAG: PmbA/TldA family metallopeptidase, partial [Candidatus Thorarchaeota archaeon]
MSEQMSLEEALTYGIKFAEKNGAEQVEGYNCHSQEIEISVDKTIPTIKTGISSGLSFRVISNSNMGFAFTKTLAKTRIEETIKIAIQNAKAKGKNPDLKSLPLPSDKKVIDFPFDKKLESLTSDVLADKFSEMIEQIKDAKGIHYLQGQIFIGIQEDHIMNSNGIDISGKGGGLGGFASAITTKGLIPNYSFCVKGGPTVKSFSVEDLAYETIKQTQRAAGPKTINFEKEVPIILEPEASLGLLGGLFRILSQQLTGDNVASGSTPYSDQVGNEVAVENF